VGGGAGEGRSAHPRKGEEIKGVESESKVHENIEIAVGIHRRISAGRDGGGGLGGRNRGGEEKWWGDCYWCILKSGERQSHLSRKGASGPQTKEKKKNKGRSQHISIY